MTTTHQDLAARLRTFAYDVQAATISDAMADMISEALNEAAAALEAASQPPGAVEREADPLTQLIQRLNSSPYNLTKDECIEEAKALRAALSARSPAQVPVVEGEAIPEGCTPADARVLREANHAMAAENQRLREALRFYAAEYHFGLSDPSAWDTVSGEGTNFWCDEAGTATVEDGWIAQAALRGEPIDWGDEGAPPLCKGEPEELIVAGIGVKGADQ